MGWNPRGLIFDVRDWGECQAVGAFAQAPQALVLDDSVRVYFSTRFRDDRGSWWSDVALAEFSSDFSELVAEPRAEVMSRGGLGCFADVCHAGQADPADDFAGRGLYDIRRLGSRHPSRNK